MMRTTFVIVVLVATIALAPASLAITSGPFPIAIEEVPVERLLKNLERNRRNLRGSDYWQAFARIHLLAYIRQTSTLPAASNGKPDDAFVSEGPFEDCTPIARTGKTNDKPVAKCKTEDTQYGYPAERGLPEGTLLVRHPPDAHLEAARSAYQRVRAMNPVRIRPRLALAFVYDRFGQIDEAIAELRYIVDRATTELNNSNTYARTEPDRYWDYQIVAAEAIEHLSLISKAWKDRERIAKLRLKLKRPQKSMLFITPILVPLIDADGLKSLIDEEARIAFDLTGQGVPLRAGWLKKDAAWLVWDPGNKQKITSGFQLFGSVTWLTPWENGYLALGGLDDNGDGKIAGAELKGLALWRDENANGVSEKGEVKPVTDWNVTALSYAYKSNGDDGWISKSGVTFANGEMRPTFDWNIRAELVVSQARTAPALPD